MNTFFHTEYFFPRKSPVNCLLPPEMDERETPRKIGAVRKPSQKRPFRTRSITLPEMNPCNAHGIVHSDPRSSFRASRPGTTAGQKFAAVRRRRTDSTSQLENEKQMSRAPFVAAAAAGGVAVVVDIFTEISRGA